MKIPRKIPLIPEYLRLNAQPLIYTSWIVIVFVSFIVFLGLHKSVLMEITEILMILAISLFLFLFIGLYRGMVLQAEDPHVLNDIKTNIEKHEIPDFSGTINTASYIEFGTLLSWIVLAIFAVCLLGYLLFFGLYFLVLLLMILYLVFYLAYGMVFRHSQNTKGDVLTSLLYSMGYTILYTGLFFTLIQVIKFFQHS